MASDVCWVKGQDKTSWKGEVKMGRSVGSTGDGDGGGQGRLPQVFCCRAGKETRELELENRARGEDLNLVCLVP